MSLSASYYGDFTQIMALYKLYHLLTFNFVATAYRSGEGIVTLGVCLSAALLVAFNLLNV